MILSLTLGAAMAASSPQDLGLEAMRNFGRCVVDIQPAGAARVLAMDFRTKEYLDQLSRLMRGHSRCIGAGSIGSRAMLFAGALAEALLEKNHGAQVGAALVRPVGAAALPSRSVTETATLCIALQAPQETAALLRTAPATAEERAASQPLLERLPSCLAAGQQVQLNRPALRAVLALAAYRIAAANGAPGAKRN
jgi:hypothetical protein